VAVLILGGSVGVGSLFEEKPHARDTIAHTINKDRKIDGRKVLFIAFYSNHDKFLGTRFFENAAFV